MRFGNASRSGAADEAHETGEAHEVDPARQEQRRERPVVGVAIGKVARVQVNRVDARVARALEPRRVGAVRHDHGDAWHRGAPRPIASMID